VSSPVNNGALPSAVGYILRVQIGTARRFTTEIYLENAVVPRLQAPFHNLHRFPMSRFFCFGEESADGCGVPSICLANLIRKVLGLSIGTGGFLAILPKCFYFFIIRAE